MESSKEDTKIQLREKIKNIDIEDLSEILEKIKYDNNEKEEDAIIKYIENTFDKKRIDEEQLLTQINVFFIDTIELLLNLLNEKKINKKINVNQELIEGLIKNIKIKKDKSKGEIDDDFCVAVIIRCAFIFNSNEQEFINASFPKQYIISKFKEINILIIKSLEKFTSIFSNEVLAKDCNYREGSKRIDKIMKNILGIKSLNKLVFESLKKEVYDEKFNILYLFLITKYSIHITIATTLGSIITQSYLKYQKILANKEFLVVMRIALLVYEGEYKRKYGGIN